MRNRGIGKEERKNDSECACLNTFIFVKFDQKNAKSTILLLRLLLDTHMPKSGPRYEKRGFPERHSHL